MCRLDPLDYQSHLSLCPEDACINQAAPTDPHYPSESQDQVGDPGALERRHSATFLGLPNLIEIKQLSSEPLFFFRSFDSDSDVAPKHDDDALSIDPGGATELSEAEPEPPTNYRPNKLEDLKRSCAEVAKVLEV